MTATRHVKVLIIGSGPAGYTAAIYAARANLAPLMVTGMEPGGQLMITTDVENYPGYADVVQGPWMMEQMRLQAEKVGTEIAYDVIVDVDFKSRPFRAWGDGGMLYTADAVIITTGASARWLGIPSEEHFRGFGVSACATCDGFFFRGKQVAVIGGGNTAVEEALYLTNHASKVTLIHRRETLRAEQILQTRLAHNPKIEVIWNSTVDEILGEKSPPGVTGLRLRNVKDGAEVMLPVDGVFVAIGHVPATGVFQGHIDIDPDGYIRTAPDSTATNVPGVYAAGDVKDRVYRQAVTAAGMGCMAALEVERYLAHQPLQAAAE
jgi:thioredoxin reductase (NADPH)